MGSTEKQGSTHPRTLHGLLKQQHDIHILMQLQTIVRGLWAGPARDNEHLVCQPGSKLLHNFCSVIDIMEQNPSWKVLSLHADANHIQE